MKTEVYGTFGPACDSEEILKKMIDAGMTGMRLNLSHTTLAQSKEIVEKYHHAAEKAGIKPQILIDMQGPELRVGALEEIEPEDEILLDDGKILARVVEKTDEKMVEIEVLRGGILHSHKSVKIVGKNISLPALTPHDIENIKVANAYGVTALMQPFVISGAQLREVRAALNEHGADQVKIFAKIENRLGVENIEDILPEAEE